MGTQRETGDTVDVLTSRTIIHPADLERSLAFYGETLNLPVAREFGEGEGRGVVFFAGGGLIEVVAARQPQLPSVSDGRPADGPVTLWLQVRSIDATVDELVGRGRGPGPPRHPRAMGPDRGVDHRSRRAPHPPGRGARGPSAPTGPAQPGCRGRPAMTASEYLIEGIDHVQLAMPPGARGRSPRRGVLRRAARAPESSKAGGARRPGRLLVRAGAGQGAPRGGGGLPAGPQGASGARGVQSRRAPRPAGPGRPSDPASRGHPGEAAVVRGRSRSATASS